MYSIISQSGNISTYVTEFLIDTISELTDLPKYPKVAHSSRAICLEDNCVYVLGNDNEWHLFISADEGKGPTVVFATIEDIDNLFKEE